MNMVAPQPLLSVVSIPLADIDVGVSVLHFSMVQANIERTMRLLPVNLNKGTMH
ncbi:hypothetical protein NKW44_11825 [Acetobacter lovaniensis]|jgi:hypothetical protein|uniref:hypothetical protein n=1 Tax=Acetobacter TaxID=434 RepID=UPI00209CDB3C|nr:hypothetical protein [Acetobacter lovaniensis]MCP1240377.1 hypothetical protein [Acetobacter lovaniensis]